MRLAITAGTAAVSGLRLSSSRSTGEMDMRHATIAAALLLAACGQPEPAANDENAAPSGTATTLLQPGRWTGTVEFSTADVPQDMPILLPSSGTIDKCLTPEQAQRPASFFVGGSESCDKSKVTTANGLIEGSVRCPTEYGGTSELQGEYTSTSYELTITTGNIKGHATVRRVGDCAAG